MLDYRQTLKVHERLSIVTSIVALIVFTRAVSWCHGPRKLDRRFMAERDADICVVSQDFQKHFQTNQSGER
jgi:hypothetical protein